MRFLVDANVLIAIEPFGADREPGHAIAARFLELLHEQGHQLFVHPAIKDDIAQTVDREHRDHNFAALRKYPMLQEAPVSVSLLANAGSSVPGSNDHRDLRLLAAVDRSSVETLVTEDNRLKRRATRSGLGNAVIGLAEAVSRLEANIQSTAVPLPFVEAIQSFQVDEAQLIFDSIRVDYPDFDGWMASKVRPDADGRLCWVVLDSSGDYRAIAIVKRRESPSPQGLGATVAKLSTFKVDDRSTGLKLGELILKAVFAWCVADGIDQLFVEVHAHHSTLIGFLADFGFADAGAPTPLGEKTLVKDFRPPADTSNLSDLDYHIRFGPPALRPTQNGFVIPVVPQWFDELFPESVGVEYSVQPTLTGMETEPRPVGSAIRKAYLSNSRSNLVSTGDLVAFYRSHPEGGGSGYLYSAGIVEGTLRSRDPSEILDFVGIRTVYTLREIQAMCSAKSGVLAIMFRQDRLIERQLTLEELIRQQVLQGAPQSITKVATTEGLQWLVSQVLA